MGNRLLQSAAITILVYELKSCCIPGVFKAGERLPSERELSERFNTSRTTIREAIIMLELKGVLNVKSKGQGFCRSSPLSSTRNHYYPIEIGPFELLQARQVVESNITGFAASQISFNELQELKKIISLQENISLRKVIDLKTWIIVFMHCNDAKSGTHQTSR